MLMDVRYNESKSITSQSKTGWTRGLPDQGPHTVVLNIGLLLLTVTGVSTICAI